MNPTKRDARFAGFLYLLVAVIAPIAVIYIPSRLIVRGDATATASRVVASESLFRIGIAGQLVSTIVFLMVVLALHRLLKGVDEKRADLMRALVLVAVPVALVNELNSIAALMFFKGGEFLSGFGRADRDAWGYAFLRLHSQGANIASIFWGLWLFPFGSLVIRSGFIPRFLGVFLMIAGFGYLVSSFTTILLPQNAAQVGLWALPLYFGELPIIVWLLIWGVKEPPSMRPDPIEVGPHPPGRA